MNNQEAKFILSGYRPNGVDANDKLFGDALQQARQDPTLAAWLAREQAYDAVVSRKIQEITPPAGLREAILTGARMSSSQSPVWRKPLWMALAAAAAVFVVSAIGLWPNQAAAETNLLTEFALRDTALGAHNGHGHDVAAFQALLGSSAVRLTEGLPFDVGALRTGGCRTVTVEGKEVFEICFNRDGTWYHLYAMRAPSESLAKVSAVAFKEAEKLCCATWADPANGYVYALVGRSGTEALKPLL